MSYGTEITCPKCFHKHDADELEKNTEYECWSSDSVYVNCPDCDFGFEVQCVHRGFQATETFDMWAFRKAHKVIYPPEIASTLADHFLQQFIETGSAQPAEDNDPKYKQRWADAYVWATAEWERIQSALGSK